MAYRQMHLNKSGSGMASKTACGRNILSTPMSTNWEEFKKEAPEHQCAKCAASKQAALNARTDAKKAAPVAAQDEEVLDASGWEPVEDVDAWKDADAKLIAAKKAK